MSEENKSGYNPFSHSKIEEILEKREKAKRAEAIIEEHRAAYKKALNSLARSKNGALVLRMIMKYCGVFSFDNVLNPANLVRDEGKKMVWNEMIRPYLTKENRTELEE